MSTSVSYPKSFLDVDNTQRRPMNQTETSNMSIGIITDLRDLRSVEAEPLKGTIMYATIIHRLHNWGNVDLTQGALAVLLAWSTGRPGDMVMWAYTTKCLARELGKNLITVDDLVNAFPMGIPTDQAREQIWREQKIAMADRKNITIDNLFDLPETWD